MRRLCRPLDLLILVFALALVAVSAAAVYAGAGERPALHVKSGGERYILPLDRPQLQRVRGPLGETVIEVREGGARVVSSPCSEQICVKSGRISRPGQWVACLPNQVFITITAAGKADIDAFSF
jgi:hypothetical protein